jgi:hypothetical protein
MVYQEYSQHKSRFSYSIQTNTIATVIAANKTTANMAKATY